MNRPTIHELFPQMPAAERLALAMFAEMRGLLDGDADLQQAADDRAKQSEDFRQWSHKHAARLLRVAGLDPKLLRWCSWPNCVESFDVTTGPTETGWMRRGANTLLCPAHDDLGHHPSFDWNGSAVEPALIGHCSCGARSGALAPTNRRAVLSWWATHVNELPEGESR